MPYERREPPPFTPPLTTPEFQPIPEWKKRKEISEIRELIRQLRYRFSLLRELTGTFDSSDRVLRLEAIYTLSQSAETARDRLTRKIYQHVKWKFELPPNPQAACISVRTGLQFEDLEQA